METWPKGTAEFRFDFLFAVVHCAQGNVWVDVDFLCCCLSGPRERLSLHWFPLCCCTLGPMESPILHWCPLLLLSFRPKGTSESELTLNWFSLLLLSFRPEGISEFTQTSSFAVVFQVQGNLLILHWFPLLLCFSAATCHFATSSHDQTVKLWTLDRVYPLRSFIGHTQDVEVGAYTLWCHKGMM